jgi:hypothetical protein
MNGDVELLEPVDNDHAGARNLDNAETAARVRRALTARLLIDCWVTEAP